MTFSQRSRFGIVVLSLCTMVNCDAITGKEDDDNQTLVLALAAIASANSSCSASTSTMPLYLKCVMEQQIRAIQEHVTTLS